MKQMLVREPSRRLTNGIVTYITRVPVDFKRAHAQWTTYIETVTHAGWQTIIVPQSASCPDGVFIEDPVVVFKDVAVLTRPSIDSASTRSARDRGVRRAPGIHGARHHGPGDPRRRRRPRRR